MLLHCFPIRDKSDAVAIYNYKSMSFDFAPGLILKSACLPLINYPESYTEDGPKQKLQLQSR